MQSTLSAPETPVNTIDDNGFPVGYPLKPDLELSARQASRGMNPAPGEPGLLLIDVRTPEEWAAAHVPGAVLIPLHELADRVDEIDVPSDTPIATICHHGMRSLKAALLLRGLGFTAARSVVGGIDLWARDVDPAVPRYDQSSGRIVRLPPR
jgi:rhodanese-related sulfurtransferase